MTNTVTLTPAYVLTAEFSTEQGKLSFASENPVLSLELANMFRGPSGGPQGEQGPISTLR